METLREFLNYHIENYSGVRLYIMCSDVADDLESDEWAYLNDKTIGNWSYSFGAFHIELNDWRVNRYER